MQIYIKDGKALKVGSQFVKPAGGVNKRWLLNDVIVFPSSEDTIYDALFMLPQSTLTTQFIAIKFSAGLMSYLKTGDEIIAYDDGYNEWNPAFGNLKYIEFLEEPTGDLLVWLQANGTPQ